MSDLPGRRVEPNRSAEPQGRARAMPSRYKIHGLDCAEEVAALKQEVGPVVGGAENLAFDILAGQMRVSAAIPATSDDILRAIARAGLRGEVWVDRPPPDAAPTLQARYGRTALTALSGLAGLAGLAVHAWSAGSLLDALVVPESAAGDVPLAAKLLFAGAALCGTLPVLPKAWNAIRRLRPDMNLLMTVAVAGALGIGQWAEAATVAFLFSLSLALEAWSIGRARRAIAALLNLTPPQARVVRPDGHEEQITPRDVPVGSTLVVWPGERIPLDGQVVEGSTAVNQAPITGESLPAVKGPGDEVFAGTINGDGAIRVRTTKAAEDTTLAKIVRLVGEAQSRRGPSEQWVERFARVYTPVVMSLALGIFLLQPAFGSTWRESLYNALVLLVIACPCALVISTPVSIVAALTAAARHGILVKGGVYIELPSRLQAIAFDKTGTLTQGQPVVVETVPLNGHTDRQLLERAAALEARSSHPLAVAIVSHARERGIEPAPAADVQILPGKGALARFDGRPFWLGSHRYLEERGEQSPEVHERLEALSSAGRTVVAIGNDDHVCGLMSLADPLRKSTAQAIAELRRSGVSRLVILTGDNEPTAREVARAAGLTEYQAELLPQDKVAAVEKLVAEHGVVAMIGDGINDAPALARASLGIAMGAASSDAALETADVALLNDDLRSVAWLVRHSRRTVAIIRQNILASLGVKAAFVALALVGLASLWSAIAADMGVSLLVVLNGLRLLGGERSRP